MSGIDLNRRSGDPPDVKFPTWFWNESAQVGTDLGDPANAREYARRRPAEDEERLVERLGVGPESVVVDLGCGHGSFAVAAARRGAHVHAVDVSETMLQLVTDSAAASGVSDVCLHHAGFLGFSPPAGSIDLVVSRFALHHLPDFWKQVALMRIAQMLKPTGLFYLRDVVFSFDPSAYAQHVPAWIDATTEFSGFPRSQAECHVREEFSTFAWVIQGMLMRAGFRIESENHVESLCLAEYVCRPSTRSAAE